MSSRLRIIVTGLIAQHHRLGGVTWDYLQYPLGLLHMGHDVYYVEDSGEWPYLLAGDDSRPGGWDAPDCAENVRHLEATMSRFGLGARWAYRDALKGDWYGISPALRDEVVRTADLVLNVSGSLEWPGRYRGAGKLVYIDSDPVFTQLRYAREPLIEARVDAHDLYFTFGETLPSSFLIGRNWEPTRQPVVVDEWRGNARPRAAYTTVMSWTSYPPICSNGTTYGQKDIEFKRFAALPMHVQPPLEIALGPVRHGAWEADHAWQVPQEIRAGLPANAATEDVLARAGWKVVSAMQACAGVDDYRRYVCESRGEWSVAKNGYVTGSAGWFSCRSACYLAAGRPVVVQDTGFSAVLPAGRGILAFSTLEEAVAGIGEIESRYDLHARAATELAHEYFHSTIVLRSLIERALAPAEGARQTAASA
jgi:hypothetical protein